MAHEASDAELINAVRTGDEDAYAQLYRRHQAAALRFARSLTGSSAETEDLVAEAFTRVLAALRGGNGPDEAFRPYLLSAVRNAFYDLTRRATREQPVDDLAPLDPGSPFVDPALASDERRLVAAAFNDLPERWQVVLWHTEVEGEKPAAVAPLLGISANAVAALAYRAREGLRERYLHAHLSTTTDEQCRPTTVRLAAYTRNRLPRAEARQVQEHLDRCARCRLLFTELTDINSRLGALLGPAVLGTAVGYLLPTGRPAIGVGRILRRRETQAAATVAVATGIVALAVALFAKPGPTPALSEPLATDPTTRLPGATTSAWTANPTPADSQASQPIPPSSTAQPGTGTRPGSTPGQPPIASPTPTAGPTPSPTASSSTSPAESPGPSAAPSTNPSITLTARLGIGILIRGLPGFVVLAVINPAAADATTVHVTATLSLPDGVTLHATNAGDGWTCVPTAEGAVCERDGLPPGGTTLAIIQVSVALNASGGPLTALVTGEGVAPITVTAGAGL